MMVRITDEQFKEMTDGIDILILKRLSGEATDKDRSELSALLEKEGLELSAIK